MGNYKIPRERLYKKPGYSIEARKGWKYGAPVRWSVYGWTSSAMDDPSEPRRLFSHAGWRGSVKYPFGRPWTEWHAFSGFNPTKNKTKLMLIVGMIAFMGLIFSGR